MALSSQVLASRMLALLISCLLAAHAVSQQPAEDASDSAETQSSEQTVPSHLASPRETMSSFLASMEAMLGQPSRSHRVPQGLDASSVLRQTLAIDESVSPAAAKEIGTRLYAVLHRIDDYTADLSGFYGTSELADVESQTGAVFEKHLIWPRSGEMSAGEERRAESVSRELRLAGVQPEIAIAIDPITRRWVFTDETVTGIGDFFDAVRSLPQPFGVETDGATVSIWLERHLPSWSLRRDYTLRNWQWIGLALVVFGGFAADLLARSALFAIWRRIRPRREGELDSHGVKRSVKPFGMLIGATIWYWGVAALGLPPLWATVLQIAARVVVTLAAILAAWRLTDIVADMVLARTRKTASHIDDLLVPLASKTLKIIVLIFGVVWVAKSLHLDVAPVLAGLGVGGLAFAFAAKDTIENLFGSVAVILDRPFQVGDWVIVDGTEGMVETVGLRSTRIRTFYNSQVTVPNAALVRAVVDNYGRRRYRRYKTTINVTYDTAPDSIEAFCEGIRELVRAHPYTRKDYYLVYMDDFGAHSLDILMVVFFECPDIPTEKRERQRLILDIVRLAHRLGVDFAFPTQTLHLHTAGRAPEADAVADLDMNTERLARKQGLKAAQALTKDAIWRSVKPAPPTFAADGSEADGEGDGTR